VLDDVLGGLDEAVCPCDVLEELPDDVLLPAEPEVPLEDVLDDAVCPGEVLEEVPSAPEAPDDELLWLDDVVCPSGLLPVPAPEDPEDVLLPPEPGAPLEGVFGGVDDTICPAEVLLPPPRP
jgi:hypothetical protein